MQRRRASLLVTRLHEVEPYEIALFVGWNALNIIDFLRLDFIQGKGKRVTEIQGQEEHLWLVPLLGLSLITMG